MLIKQNYLNDGLIKAVDAISPDRAIYYSRKCENFIDQYSSHPNYIDWTYGKTELLLQWVAQLAAEETLLNIVQELIGPNILLWNAFLPVKPPHSTGKFDWHQDATYWPVSPANEIVSFWVALSSVNQSNGGMQMVKGSHAEGPVAHETTFDKNSMLRRGQKVSVPADDPRIVNINLEPGQASIHHTLMLHRSQPNSSDNWRLGVGLNYASSNVNPRPGYEDSAILLRGNAHKTNFELMNSPKSDLDNDALANFAKSQQLQSTRYSDVK